PAESHFLRMLSRYLPPVKDRLSPIWELVAQALSIRRQAEAASLGIWLGKVDQGRHLLSRKRAGLAVVEVAEQPREYHYCEHVHPRIRSLIEAADLLRRRGEDLLFSAAEPDWNHARMALDEAGKSYKKASERAATIRFALATRDRVLAN